MRPPCATRLFGGMGRAGKVRKVSRGQRTLSLLIFALDILTVRCGRNCDHVKAGGQHTKALDDGDEICSDVS
jgi:hypothetical protein